MPSYVQYEEGATRRSDGSIAIIPRARYHAYGRSETIKTPQHAARRRDPSIFMPPTPMSAYDFRYCMFQGGYEDTSGNVETGYRESRPRFVEQSDQIIDIIRAKALNKALAALKSQNINFAQAFAERAQTANLVASSATRLAKTIWALRHGDIRKACDTLGVTRRTRMKGVGDTWLELQYGWKPLLSDVHGAMEELRKHDADSPGRYRFSAKGSARDKYSNKYEELNGDIVETGYETANYGCFVRLDAQVDSGLMASLAAGGFTNPLSVAWELVPFSFVADWFMPIGEYLNLKDAWVGYAFLGGSSTTRFYGTRTSCEQHRIGSILSSLRYWSYSRGLSSKKYVNREVFGTPPTSQLPVKNPMSMGHVANALALLQSACRGALKGMR